MPEALKAFRVGAMGVAVLASGRAVGEAAAEHAAGILAGAVRANGSARVIIATGNSQLPFVEALCVRAAIPWGRITAFHMDEYVGMTEAHPASFRRWIRERIEEPLRPRAVHYLAGDAADREAECRRYEALLREAPIDLVCMGIGENGHIAFNDPPVADFADPVWVKVVELDEACRRQQVGEGHFAGMADVPTHALTLTVPALLAPRALQMVAPERRKAEAVRAALTGPVDTACPASILREQAHALLFLDTESAALL
ncbi:MAG: glucosamine-6-phosphate deaminase [Chloroflexota bacterium]|nr:glucosamine-6-phosphate deaminase [Chloroflexota bacterium]